jgi:uncharacterized repeat protein (TIGR03803 family)
MTRLPFPQSRISPLRGQRSFRPRLEVLEDRVTPTLSLVGVASFPNTGNILVGTNPAVDSQGNLYITSNSQTFGATTGAVLEVAANTRAITTLATFNGDPGAGTYDGFPQPGLTVDSNGNIFGTTRDGGVNGDGSIFEIAAGTHTITLLASFDNVTNGFTPNGSLLLAGGLLYGTTHQGGTGGAGGTVFSLPVGGGNITVLGTFQGGTDGAAPNSGLILSNGILYGTSAGIGGFGTVFSVPVTGGGTITGLASKASSGPNNGHLVASNGFLYGTDLNGTGFTGDIYRLPIGGGAISVVATFNNTDGAQPVGGLFQDGNTIVGATQSGGATGEGLTYSFDPTSNAINPLVSFHGPGSTNSGSVPAGGLSIDANGNVYGVSFGEGDSTLMIWELSGLPAPPPPPQNQAPAITSANATLLAEGVFGSFSVTDTGSPTPVVTETGALPTGVSFNNGLLSGTPAVGTSGAYPLVIKASNGVAPDAMQNFTLQVIVSGTINGVVFNDFNTNGVQDGGETGLAGQTLFLDAGNTGVFVQGDPTATSDAGGAYSFQDFIPGTYTVRQLLLGGTLLSAPTSGGYSVTVAAHQVVSDKNFADVSTSIGVPLTLPPTTPFPAQGNGNADYVEAIFRAVLNRNADSGGLSFWAGALNQGSQTRLQVVQGIRNSVEHFRQEVDAFYQTLLRRQADSGGESFWVGQLQGGLREEQIAAAFLNSPEYLSKGDKFFVDSMYESLLGRSFDSSGEAFWLGQLGDNAAGSPAGTPTQTHAQVVNDFLFSTESLQRLVNGYYAVFLQRQADTSGLNSWVAQLQKGLPFLTIGEEFVASDEFFNKAVANM